MRSLPADGDFTGNGLGFNPPLGQITQPSVWHEGLCLFADTFINVRVYPQKEGIRNTTQIGDTELGSHKDASEQPETGKREIPLLSTHLGMLFAHPYLPPHPQPSCQGTCCNSPRLLSGGSAG